MIALIFYIAIACELAYIGPRWLISENMGEPLVVFWVFWPLYLPVWLATLGLERIAKAGRRRSSTAQKQSEKP